MRHTHTPADFTFISSIYMSTVSVQHEMRLERVFPQTLRFKWKSQRPLCAPQSCLHSITSFEAAGCSLPQSHVFYSNRFNFDSLIQTKKLSVRIVWSQIFICEAQHLSFKSRSHVTNASRSQDWWFNNEKKMVSNMICGGRRIQIQSCYYSLKNQKLPCNYSDDCLGNLFKQKFSFQLLMSIFSDFLTEYLWVF